MKVRSYPLIEITSNKEQPIGFAILCQRVGATAKHLSEIFRVNIRTAQYWLYGRNQKVSYPPRFVYETVVRINNEFFKLANEFAKEHWIESILVFHHEDKLLSHYPSCCFGLSGHRAFISLILNLRSDITTSDMYTDEMIFDYPRNSWGGLASFVPEIDYYDIDNIRVGNEVIQDRIDAMNA